MTLSEALDLGYEPEIHVQPDDEFVCSIVIDGEQTEIRVEVYDVGDGLDLMTFIGSAPIELTQAQEAILLEKAEELWRE